MNKLTRLTALLLAMLMIFSTVASAESAFQVGDMTLDQWNALVENVDTIVGTPAVDKGDSGAVVRPETPDQPTMGAAPAGNQYLVTTQANLSEGPVEDAVLYTSGKLIITSAQADQWQINVGGVWVSITGENGQTITVTNAMVEGLGTSVQVRQAGTPENIAYISVKEYAATMMLVAAARAAEAGEEEVVAPTAADDVMTIEETNQYTVIINYNYADGTMAANPYTASLGKGTPFSATVEHPTVIGYEPSFKELVPPEMSGVTYSAKDVKIDISSIQNNVVVYITYVPSTVNYTVIHYHQNVDNDNYTIVGNTVNTGTTGTQVPETDIAEAPAGFYALLYDRPTIAADGSTIVEIYYDRYYYLMNFDLGGGYGVEPIYARYGTPIEVTGTPVKAGYVFKGWATTQANADAGIADATVAATMPPAHTTYYAVWEVEELAKVSVVIWGENPNDEDYAYQKTIEIYAKPGSTISFTTANTICGYTAHTHNESCYDCGVTAHTHGPDCCTIEAHTHSEACCTIAVHTHGLSCYPNVGTAQEDAPWGAPSGPVNGQIYSANFWGQTYRYIYINGIWYRYTANANNNAVIQPNCGQAAGSHADHTCVYCDKTEHTHDGTDCVYCDLDEHTHTEECFSCTLTEHTHTSSCYITDPNMASNLWELKTSDTVTVAADGSTVMNVYYDRKEFTLTFKNGNTTEFTLTKKWGADISGYWPIGTEGVSETKSGRVYDEGERWDPSGSSEYSEVLVFLEIMPDHSFTLTVSEVNYDTFIMHYMVEALASETTGVTTYTYGGTTKRFKQAFVVEANYNYVTKAEDFFDVEGFTQWTSNPQFSGNSLDINGGGDVYFYYTRNSYTLSFNDGYNVVKTETVLYGDSWAQFESYEPALPSQYEAGSRDFAGWYWNPQGTSDQIKLSEETMPAENVIVYAKWTPKEYKVRFFLTEDLMKTGLDENVYIPQFIYDAEDNTVTPAVGDPALFPKVPHGTVIVQEYVEAFLDYDAMIAADPRDPYQFVAWFYYDENGDKQPFDPTMQIKQNLDLFAEWTSDVLVPYTIKYMIEGTTTEVAAPTTGSKLAGQPETFEAKGGDELYAAYQEGYFPTLGSHTINFTVEQFEDGGVEYIFWYTSATAVPYKVYYKIVDENGNILGPAIVNNGVEYVKEVSDNKKAVVTENFVVVSGYMPDAYQKRLVISTTGENVITFYYTKDELHAYYQVTHYIQTLDGQWVEYLPPSQIQGDIGMTDYADEPLTIDGYTYKETKYDGQVLATAPELTNQGLKIDLYYTLNSYPYVVNYYRQGTTTKLADSKPGSGLYGATVTEQAIDIPGYTKVAPTEQSLTIRIEAGTTPAYNIINFYYAEIPATINYIPVTSDGTTKNVNSSDGGTVSPSSETIGAVTGTALGSVPAVKANYTFKGWYTDETCTTAVDSSWVDANKITPQKTKDYDAGTGVTMGYESKNYYALFEENSVTLNYVAVGPEGATDFGSVEPASETIKAVTGEAEGSTATAGAGYRFVGWYDNEKCEGSTLSTDAEYVPTQTGGAWVDGTTYYAKFEEIQTTYTYVAAFKDGTTVTIDDATGGLVDLNDSTNTPASTETEPVPVKTGAAVGATAEANANHTFLGWYSDAACTQKVTDAVSYVPGKNTTTNLYEGAIYYALFEENVVTITYIPMYEKADGTLAEGTTGGAVTPTSETVKVVTGTVQGSTATAVTPTYKFEGWYSDAACQNKVSGDAAFVPAKVDGLNVAATYYAKFVYDVGHLTITKKVVNDTGFTPVKTQFTFTVKLNDDKVNGTYGGITFTNGVGTVTLANGETATISNLLNGTQYTITETPETGFTTTNANGTGNKVTGTIVPGATVNETFTNTYYVGTLTVTKTVQGADAPKVNDVFSDEFNFTLTVPGFAGLKVTVNGAEKILGSNGETTFTMKHGETVTINGIPDGADYTVTEATNSDYTTTANGQTGTMDADAATPAKADFVNTYKYSHLTIKKTGMEPGESAIFQVTGYSKYNNDEKVTFTISVPNNGEVTIGELLIGSDYTITEIGSWSNRYAAVTVPSGKIVEGGKTVTVTNGDKNHQWLHGEDYVHNNFSKPGSYGN